MPAVLEMAGEAVPIAEGLPDAGRPLFSVSTTGVLAYRTGSSNLNPTTQLTWFDRAGKILGTVGEPGQYDTLALSPDGTRVAFDRNDPQAAGRRRGNMDIWLHEFSRGTSARFTFDPGADIMAVWSPDGSRIIFASNRDGVYNLYQKVANGAGNEEALLQSNEAKYPYDWSQDGRFLLYAVGREIFDLWMLPLTGDDRKPMPYLQAEAGDRPGAVLSRQPLDCIQLRRVRQDGGLRKAVPRGVGRQMDGFERRRQSASLAAGWQGVVLHFRRFQMMSVGIGTASGALQAGIPKALFAAPIWGGGTTNNVTRYDVTADGKKFLINVLPAETASARPSAITVVRTGRRAEEMSLKK